MVRQTIVVLGLFRGGTSCTAGALSALGLSCGRRFRAAKSCNPRGFFEDEDLGDICRASYQEPWFRPQNTPAERVAALAAWRQRQPTAVCAKHPTLCLMVPEICQAWPEAHFVVVQRPLAECIASLERLGWGWPPNAARAQLPKLRSKRDRDLAESGFPQLRIHYADLLRQPERTLRQLCAFCQLEPTAARWAEACRFPDPQLQHHHADGFPKSPPVGPAVA